MKNQPAPPASIVVGVADVPVSSAALDWAADEAVATSRPLHVVHVVEAVHHSPVDFSGHVDQPAERAVTGILASRPSLRVTAQTDTGSAAGALVAASRTAAMLVVGAVAHSLLEAVVLGSVALQVAAHSSCPVVVVRAAPRADTRAPAPAETPGPGPVVVGLDASERSERALAFAFEQASRRQVGLTAVACWAWEDSGGYVPGPLQVGVWEDAKQQEERLVSELLAGWREKYPDVEVRTHLVRARTVPALLEAAAGASLLVVGTRGRGGFDGLLLGSVSQRVIERASCPVAVVPSPDLDDARPAR
ncbi:MAG: universal stress protein [Lapillicoccus sp.]